MTMLNRRSLLIESFKDTMNQIKDTPGLAEKTRKMQGNTILYMPGYEAYCPHVKSRKLPIRVLEDTSFHAAQMLLQKNESVGRVAVLNFANAYSPGGGVTDGDIAQEECLCRSSNLYCGLTIPYLIRNYYKANKRTTGDMGTDAVIWSPDVTVFKSDDLVPVMLDAPFEVDVLTCAAPYYNPCKKHPVSMEQMADVFYRRVLNVLNVAAANDVDSIVLGAFGCGAFNNPPDLVAEAFYRVLIGKQYRDYFRIIVFAIKKNDRDNSNLRAFEQRFSADSRQSESYDRLECD